MNMQALRPAAAVGRRVASAAAPRPLPMQVPVRHNKTKRVEEPHVDTDTAVMDRRGRLDLSGFLVLHKPRGVRSAHLVAQVRHAITSAPTTARKGTKVGHGGTLDEFASGVMVVGVGAACRDLTRFLNGPKTYRATGRLGVATDTQDPKGKVTAERDASGINREAVEAVLGPLRGIQMQRTPQYSARKVNGVRFSDLARRGEPVPERLREIDISRLECVGFESPDFQIEVACSRGTYIRQLVSDIGEELGVGAHTTALLRTGQGPFSLADCLEVHPEASDNPDSPELTGLSLEVIMAHLQTCERFPAGHVVR